MRTCPGKQGRPGGEAKKGQDGGGRGKESLERRGLERGSLGARRSCAPRASRLALRRLHPGPPRRGARAPTSRPASPTMWTTARALRLVARTFEAAAAAEEENAASAIVPAAQPQPSAWSSKHEPEPYPAAHDDVPEQAGNAWPVGLPHPPPPPTPAPPPFPPLPPTAKSEPAGSGGGAAAAGGEWDGAGLGGGPAAAELAGGAAAAWTESTAVDGDSSAGAWADSWAGGGDGSQQSAITQASKKLVTVLRCPREEERGREGLRSRSGQDWLARRLVLSFWTDILPGIRFPDCVRVSWPFDFLLRAHRPHTAAK